MVTFTEAEVIEVWDRWQAGDCPGGGPSHSRVIMQPLGTGARCSLMSWARSYPTARCTATAGRVQSELEVQKSPGFDPSPLHSPM